MGFYYLLLPVSIKCEEKRLFKDRIYWDTILLCTVSSLKGTQVHNWKGYRRVCLTVAMRGGGEGQLKRNGVGTKLCDALKHVLADILVAPLHNLLFVCLTFVH